MTGTEPFEDLRQRQEVAERRYHRLNKLGHRWDHTVRDELKRLADALWPNGHVLGVIPLHQVRLRHRADEDAWLWWIERDIPPYDLFRCEAYRVVLALDSGNGPVLTVEGGAGTWKVSPLTAAGLETALGQAGENPPLLIPRAMGEARD